MKKLLMNNMPQQDIEAVITQASANMSGLRLRKASKRKELNKNHAGPDSGCRYDIVDTQAEQESAMEGTCNSLYTKLVSTVINATQPHVMHLYLSGENRKYVLKRPPRLFFDEIEVQDFAGRPLGKVKKRFGLYKNVYAAFNAAGKEIFKVDGMLEGAAVAVDMGVHLPSGIDDQKTAILLASVFLVDEIRNAHTKIAPPLLKPMPGA